MAEWMKTAFPGFSRRKYCYKWWINYAWKLWMEPFQYRWISGVLCGKWNSPYSQNFQETSNPCTMSSMTWNQNLIYFRHGGKKLYSQFLKWVHTEWAQNYYLRERHGDSPQNHKYWQFRLAIKLNKYNNVRLPNNCFHELRPGTWGCLLSHKWLHISTILLEWNRNICMYNANSKSNLPSS